MNLLYAASGGKLWASTQMHGGLRFWDGASWVDSLKTGLPMKCIVEVEKGSLWAGGVLDGIHVLGGAGNE